MSKRYKSIAEFERDHPKQEYKVNAPGLLGEVESMRADVRQMTEDCIRYNSAGWLERMFCWTRPR
jgi:hypothetical protein